MTLEQFTSSLKSPGAPKELSESLQAMWHDGRDDWESAHNIAQDIHTAEGSWIHAYLHRKEGDDGNAAYWYRRAGRPMPRVSLHEEWKQIVKELIDHSKLRKG
jgi:hypothetical protein